MLHAHSTTTTALIANSKQPDCMRQPPPNGGRTATARTKTAAHPHHNMVGKSHLLRQRNDTARVASWPTRPHRTTRRCCCCALVHCITIRRTSHHHATAHAASTTTHPSNTHTSSTPHAHATTGHLLPLWRIRRGPRQQRKLQLRLRLLLGTASDLLQLRNALLHPLIRCQVLLVAHVLDALRLVLLPSPLLRAAAASAPRRLGHRATTRPARRPAPAAGSMRRAPAAAPAAAVVPRAMPLLLLPASLVPVAALLPLIVPVPAILLLDASLPVVPIAATIARGAVLQAAPAWSCCTRVGWWQVVQATQPASKAGVEARVAPHRPSWAWSPEAGSVGWARTRRWRLLLLQHTPAWTHLPALLANGTNRTAHHAAASHAAPLLHLLLLHRHHALLLLLHVHLLLGPRHPLALLLLLPGRTSCWAERSTPPPCRGHTLC